MRALLTPHRAAEVPRQEANKLLAGNLHSVARAVPSNSENKITARLTNKCQIIIDRNTSRSQWTRCAACHCPRPGAQTRPPRPNPWCPRGTESPSNGTRRLFRADDFAQSFSGGCPKRNAANWSAPLMRYHRCVGASFPCFRNSVSKSMSACLRNCSSGDLIVASSRRSWDTPTPQHQIILTADVRLSRRSLLGRPLPRATLRLTEVPPASSARPRYRAPSRAARAPPPWIGRWPS